MHDADEPGTGETAPPERILLVDDDATSLRVLHQTLDGQGLELLIARDGEEALRIARGARPVLILLNVMMPGIDGFETCRRLKKDKTTGSAAVIFLSARAETEDKIRGFEVGGVDYITKPFQAEEVIARVNAHRTIQRLKHELEERNRALHELNDTLERRVEARSEQLMQSRDGVIFGLAKLAESRDQETGEHLERICRYTEILATEIARSRPDLDEHWVRTITTTAALHDIGKVGVPDAVLLKDGKLTDEEHAVVRKHTTIGGDTLLALKRRWGDDPFLVTAMEIVFGHHERWDGNGYPFGLAGASIPLPARIVSVADVYDALRSKRHYKDGMEHGPARDLIVEGSGSQFDPMVVETFLRVEDAFRAIVVDEAN